MGFLSFFWTNYVGKLIATFILSMSPVLELRGSILYGVTAGLDYWLAGAVSIVGNMLPVPFIILFIRKVFEWIRKHMKWLGGVVERMEAKAEKNSEKVKKYGFWGLLMFVAIPLPGTGAWTGALVAALLNMRLKNAVPAICVGVVSAGVIVTLAYAGLFGAVSKFLI